MPQDNEPKINIKLVKDTLFDVYSGFLGLKEVDVKVTDPISSHDGLQGVNRKVNELLLKAEHPAVVLMSTTFPVTLAALLETVSLPPKPADQAQST